MIIKICGITNVDDALLALEEGANALGFNFWPSSPRYIQPDKAAEIIAELQSYFTGSAVTGSAGILPACAVPTGDGATGSSRQDACAPSACAPSACAPGSFLSVGVLVGTDRWEEAPTDVLQFHGLIDAASLPKTGRRTWVAVPPENAGCFPLSEIVIDGSWGKGRLADWESLLRLARPFILAGGLTPDNVATAIERLHPAGVDVCSGVEKSPGRKDPEKLKRFLREVKRATHGTSRG